MAGTPFRVKTFGVVKSAIAARQATKQIFTWNALQTAFEKQLVLFLKNAKMKSMTVNFIPDG